MNGNDTQAPATGAALMAACGLLIALLAGCSDHRISIQEFLQMEQEAAPAPTATAPAEDTTATSEALSRQLGPYRVGTNDVLMVTLFGLDATTTTAPVQVRVDRDGTISFPAVGKIAVGDKDLLEVERAIHDALVPKVYQDVVVHVGIAEPEGTRVLVYGAVTTPGLIPLRHTERNLLYAITTAGGVSSLASGCVTLKRLRDPSHPVTFNLLDPEQLKTALAIEPLEHGDTISVEAAIPNTIFVGGLVLAPHPQPYPPGTEITVLQAIAAASGLRTDVTPREATLIRRMPNGEDVHVKLNLDRLSVGKDPNIMLVAGDVLWVPDTLETRVQDWVNRNIFVRVGATATYGANYNMSGLDFFNNAARRSQFRGTGGNLEDSFDPFGFLLRNQALQNLQNVAP
jgi:protein involved in polysaccharide export with SLBB domain